MVSNRSFYIAFYEEDLEDGSHLLVDTTKGNDHIAEANKQLTGKNVCGTVNVEYFKMTPFENGYYFTKVTQAHAGGNLPRGEYMPTKQIVADSKRDMENYVKYLLPL